MYLNRKLALLPLLGSLILSGCNQPNSSTKTQQTTNAGSTPAITATQPATTPSVGKDTKANNLPVYTALTDPTFPPFNFKNADGTVGGMEIEIFDAIAKDQGFAVNYVPHAWDGIFTSMKENNAKFVVSAVATVPEAVGKVEFSKRYYHSPYRVAAIDATKIDDWKNQPTIAISKGEDSAEELPALGINPSQLKSYKTLFLALAALQRGEADVVVGDSTVLQYLMKSDAFKQVDKKFISKDLPSDDTSDIYFGVEKGNTELLNKVNQGIDNLKASGEFDRILQKYGQELGSHNIPPSSSATTQ